MTATGASQDVGDDPPSPDSLASDFPQLEILRILGRGGMGVVYLARQRPLDRLVALKLLAPGREKNAGFAGRFASEARALASLSHPSIVTVFDFGETDNGLFYLLMEYVDGLDLRQVMVAGRLAPDEALAIVPPLCEALQYAHDRGIVHRDIKPENVLMDKDGTVKIADFGVAKLVGGGVSQVAPDSVAGTPREMAPEKAADAETIDARADIYSLGVVLYEMLTGEVPDRQWVPPSKRVAVDVRLDEVVLRALEADPTRRYQSASEVSRAVTELGAESDDVPDASPPEEADLLEDAPSLVRRAHYALIVVLVGVIVDMGGRIWVISVLIDYFSHDLPLWANSEFRDYFFAFPALIGTSIGIAGTVLGWRSLRRLRTVGHRQGVRSAVAATVVWPLFRLDVLFAFGILSLNFGPWVRMSAGIAIVVVVAVIGWFLCRVWRETGRSPGQAPSPAAPAARPTKHSRWALGLVWVAIPIFALGCIIAIAQRMDQAHDGWQAHYVLPPGIGLLLAAVGTMMAWDELRKARRSPGFRPVPGIVVAALVWPIAFYGCVLVSFWILLLMQGHYLGQLHFVALKLHFVPVAAGLGLMILIAAITVRMTLDWVRPRPGAEPAGS
ncbi:hypothetical protein BH23VER1_BH23VER1_00700 [soil metagenome]